MSMMSIISHSNVLGPLTGAVALKACGKMESRYLTHFSVKQLLVGAGLASTALSYADKYADSEKKMHKVATQICFVVAAFLVVTQAFRSLTCISQWRNFTQGAQLAAFTAAPALILGAARGARM